MKRLRLVLFASLAASAAMFALAWQRLPERVPVHWNIRGDVDRYGSRWELLLISPVVLLLLWAVAEGLRIFDPKHRTDPDLTEDERRGAIPTVLGIVAVLIVVLHGIIVLSALGLLHEPARAHALLMAGFLLVFGNFIGKLRPSWFVGIRTPWTLSSDAVWRRTHRLAGYLMVPAGLVAVLGALILPAHVAFIVAITLLMAALLVPAAASYVFWRGEAR